MDEVFVAEVWSLADWSRAAVARSIGAVLDRVPQAAILDRWGREEPARRRIGGTTGELLEEWSPRFATKDSSLYLEGPSVSVRFESCPASAGVQMAPFLRDRCFSWIEWEIEESALREGPEEIAAFGAVFAQLCEASDAFYGRVVGASMLAQGLELRRQAMDTGSLVLPDLWSDPRYAIGPENHYIDDVGWLNYFGPAFVDRWKAKALDRVGVRREPTDNGGVVVWASEAPPRVEPVDRIDDYFWKQSFYDELDSDAFAHEGFQCGAPGQHVPSFDEHRSRLAAPPASRSVPRSSPPRASR